MCESAAVGDPEQPLPSNLLSHKEEKFISAQIFALLKFEARLGNRRELSLIDCPLLPTGQTR